MSFADYMREVDHLSECRTLTWEKLQELGDRVGLDEIARQKDRYSQACEAFGRWQEMSLPDEAMPDEARRALNVMREFWSWIDAQSTSGR
jgi:hypothetical protein